MIVPVLIPTRYLSCPASVLSPDLTTGNSGTPECSHASARFQDIKQEDKSGTLPFDGAKIAGLPSQKSYN